MTKFMRAARILTFGGPKVLQIENNIPIPSISDTQVLVRIKSAGINPVDTYVREGNLGNAKLPHILGKDAAGVIAAVGKNVKNFKTGDKVFVCLVEIDQQGTYAEYVAAEEKEIFPLGNLNFHQGASVGTPYFTAYRALILQANAKKGETVLIHGASGAVGLAAVQMCKQYGMKTIGTAGTQEGMDLVKENGADYVFCHKDSNYIDAIMKVTGNSGVNVILEMLADVNLDNDLIISAHYARIMVIGFRGDVKFDPKEILNTECSVIGVKLPLSSDEELKKTGSAVCMGLNEGWLKPIVYGVYPLEKVAVAHHDIIHSKGAKGNLVLSLE